MINSSIVLRMNKIVQDICRENNVSSVSELTYSQINKIKQEFDDYLKNREL